VLPAFRHTKCISRQTVSIRVGPGRRTEGGTVHMSFKVTEQAKRGVWGVLCMGRRGKCMYTIDIPR
jgi:hypothetical protein